MDNTAIDTMEMTVGELIAELQKQPEDALVVMSKDAEGNAHSPLHDVEQNLYQARNAYSGELVAPEEIGQGEARVCVCLWPVC